MKATAQERETYTLYAPMIQALAAGKLQDMPSPEQARVGPAGLLNPAFFSGSHCRPGAST